MGGAGVRWVLRCVALGLWPTVRIIDTFTHPRWGAALSDTGALLATITGLVLIRWRYRTARHAVSRPSLLERVTLQQALWCGFPLGLLIAAVAYADLPECQVLFNVGGWLAIVCPCGLLLRWGFAEHARRLAERQQVGTQVRQLAERVLQRVDGIDRDVSDLHSGLVAAFGHADTKPPADIGPHAGDDLGKRRMRLVHSAETDPQQAILSAPLTLVPVAVAAHLLG